MRSNRTQKPPLFDILRPEGNKWEWTVTYAVASSGYPKSCHVIARRVADGEVLVGTARCAVIVGDPLEEVIEFLAVEAMLAACEPTLDGSPSHRSPVFTQHL
jgi:hypothetical protein